jgi:uncharacterized protein (DUF111 family)
MKRRPDVMLAEMFALYLKTKNFVNLLRAEVDLAVGERGAYTLPDRVQGFRPQAQGRQSERMQCVGALDFCAPIFMKSDRPTQLLSRSK